MGQDNNLWELLKKFAQDYEFTVLNIKQTKDVELIKDEFSFTIVLTELHLDYNYEGYIIDKLGLKYSYLAILTNEITEKSIEVSECLFHGQQKFLLLKTPEMIKFFLKSSQIQIHANSSQIPIEA